MFRPRYANGAGLYAGLLMWVAAEIAVWAAPWLGVLLFIAGAAFIGNQMRHDRADERAQSGR